MQTFLTKLAVLMHKVPGILLLAAIFISMDGAQIVATWAGTPLAPYMAGALKVVGYVGTILALLKQLKPGPLADAIDKATKAPDVKAGQAGFSRVEILVFASCFSALLFVGAMARRTPTTADRAAESTVSPAGCSGGGPVSPNTVQTVLTDEGYACAVVQLVDNIIVGPTTGTVEQVASAIQAACSKYIPQTMTDLVVSLINAFAAQVPPDAGVTMPALSAWLKAHPPSVHR